MKRTIIFSILCVLAASTTFLKSADAQDAWCAEHIANRVEQKAQMDFPGQKLRAELPDLKGRGIQEWDFQVPVVEHSQIVAVYGGMIGETCHVISGPTRVR